MKGLLFCLLLMFPSCEHCPPLSPPSLLSLDNAIVQLDIGGESSSHGCSGVLVGPFVVLTAAHCVTGEHQAKSIRVWPGGDSTKTVVATSWEYEVCYIDPSSSSSPEELLTAQQCDFAVVFLSEPLGHTTGWFTPSLPQRGTLYRVRGWPVDAKEPLNDAGPVVLKDGLIYNRMVAQKGMSGGPIYRADTVVGLVTWLSEDGENIGLPLTPDRLEYLTECNQRAWDQYLRSQVCLF